MMNMKSKEQIKNEINQVLDHLSERGLEELLTFLKQLEQKNEKSINQEHLQKILSQDRELLQRLAQ